MSNSKKKRNMWIAIICVVIVVIVAVACIIFFNAKNQAEQSNAAMNEALQDFLNKPETDESLSISVTLDEYIKNYNAKYVEASDEMKVRLPGPMTVDSFKIEDGGAFQHYELLDGANLIINCDTDNTIVYLEYVCYFPNSSIEFDDMRATANHLSTYFIEPLDIETYLSFGDLQDKAEPNGDIVTQQIDNIELNFSLYQSGNDTAFIYGIGCK